MKLTDYIVKFFEEQGLKDVFMLSGGGCQHLINSFGNSEKITYWCLHHEQCVSMAVEAYARMKNDIGVPKGDKDHRRRYHLFSVFTQTGL